MPRGTSSRNLPLLTEAEVEARRPVLLAGIDQFNAGYFFEAHETWEALWLQSPWPVRRFLQGLIQVAAAFVHLVRREYPGTVGLLGAAIEKLESFPEHYMGIEAGRFAAGARRAREEIEALGAEGFEEWERTRIPAIELVDSARRL